MRVNLIHSLKDQFKGFFTLRRSISYVEKYRYIQALKSDELECLAVLPESKFLVYNKSRPLLKEKKSEGSSPIFELNWLTYKDLLSHKEAISQTAVLIDVDDHKTPRFGIKLKKCDEDSIKELEEITSGLFTDLRVSLFMVNWKEGQLISRANSLLQFNSEQLFCSKCKGKLIRNSSGNVRRCSECTNVVYPTSNPVGIVLVIDSRREHAVLVRQPRHPRGWYTCIAGFSDVGESLESTVKREVAEEVGIEVNSVDYVMSQHWPFPSSVMFGCYALAEKSELTIDPLEIEDGKWFSRLEIEEAVSRVESNPKISISEHKEGIYIPPPGSVAHQLISNWIKSTPPKDIHRFVK